MFCVPGVNVAKAAVRARGGIAVLETQVFPDCRDELGR
jgi:hypothetical protein